MTKDRVNYLGCMRIQKGTKEKWDTKGRRKTRHAVIPKGTWEWDKPKFNKNKWQKYKPGIDNEKWDLI